MAKLKDLTGQVFGLLTVIERVNNLEKKRTKYLCKCSCGKEKVIQGNHLVSGKILSCGCLRSKTTSLKNFRHGFSSSRLYSIWNHMKQRCFNNSDTDYNSYGARGITVCDEWKNDFMNFYNWAMQNGYSDSLTIDRIDVNGNYCPENCRWIKNQEQADNRRNSIRFNVNNTQKSIKDLANLFEISYQKVYRDLVIHKKPLDDTLIEYARNQNGRYI